MERFKLTDIQAQAILDMRLKTLSGLQREKIEEEYNELMKLIAHLRDSFKQWKFSIWYY